MVNSLRLATTTLGAGVPCPQRGDGQGETKRELDHQRSIKII